MSSVKLYKYSFSSTAATNQNYSNFLDSLRLSFHTVDPRLCLSWVYHSEIHDVAEDKGFNYVFWQNMKKIKPDVLHSRKLNLDNLRETGDLSEGYSSDYDLSWLGLLSFLGHTDVKGSDSSQICRRTTQ